MKFILLENVALITLLTILVIIVLMGIIVWVVESSFKFAPGEAKWIIFSTVLCIAFIAVGIGLLVTASA